MAIEFNIDAAKRWFLGEDKIIEFVVYAQDNVTPLDVTGMPLEYVLRKRDKDPDPALILKTTSDDISIVGSYSSNPSLNTQKVRIVFASDDTTDLRPLTYRYSVKRTDAGNEGILVYGDQVLLQATAH